MRSAAVLVLAGSLLALTLITSPLRAQGTVEWHGYGQFGYTRSTSTAGFGLRRGKLWMQGPVPSVENLFFKVQGVFRTGAAGAFVLQDFFVEYQGPFGRLRIGQMVPNFTLQRSQPDYVVPLVERAGVVNALIPGARTLARDIGAQILLGSATSPLHLSAGVFNGSGANHSRGEEGDFLATTRLTYTRHLSPGLKGAVGVSGAYRSTAGTDVGLVATAEDGFSGEDTRWGVETHLKGERWEVQGEYLEGRLEGEVSRGYYFLGDYSVSSSNQVVFSTERLQTPGSDRREDPWYIAGFDHFFYPPESGGAGHTPVPDGSLGRLPTKLMADMRVQPSETGTQYGATLQVQFFLH